MKWFSHESMASRDTKLKKLLMKYGAEGYGLYWYCVEHVCANVDPKLTFELEHDSEILAHELKVDTLLVEEMMRYMVSVGLFEESNGIVTCLKLAKHLGENCTRNEGLKTLIKASKKFGVSQSVSDSIRLSENVSAIRDNKIGEDKKNNTPKTSARGAGLTDVFESWWKTYPRKKGKADALMAFKKLKAFERDAMLADHLVARYSDTEEQFIPHGSTYVRKKAWLDELPRRRGGSDLPMSQRYRNG